MTDSDDAMRRSDEDRALLDALFTQSPVGLHLVDPELRVLRFNTAGLGARSWRAQDIVGRRFTETYGLVEPRETEKLVREVLESGVPLIDRVVRARPEADAAHDRLYSVSVFRLQAEDGTVLGLAAAVVDVTERERARARMRVLDAARESVGSTLDVAVICRELADIVVPAFADTVVVEVVDSVMRGDDPPPPPLPPGVPLRRAAFRSRAEGAPQAHPVGDVRDIPAPTPYTQTLTDLRPRVLSLNDDPPWLAADPARAEAILGSGAHTLLLAPMTLHGTVLGLISLYRTGQSDPYDEEDVTLALGLANHTALCIDNARRYTREHTIAAALGRPHLPCRPVPHTALETVGMPCSPEDGVGWCDTIALSSARSALVVGEVAGRGIHAVATMGQLRTLVRSLAAFDLGPDELLARLDDTVKLLDAERAALPTTDALHHEPLAATCTYAVYDPLSHSCTTASAGRPSCVIAHPGGTLEIPDTATGPTLGEADSTPFAATTFGMPEGDTLALASPSMTSDPAGEPGILRQALSRADRPLPDLRDEILFSFAAHAAATPAAVLLARVRRFPSDRVATWQIDPDPTAVAAARRHVRAQLATWDVEEETADNTGLIVSELVTNAVRHGRPPIELRLINDRALTCEVRDTSPAAPHLRHARTVDEGGRGLFIVGRLAQVWGTRYTAEGKTIWAEQSLPSPSG
ncbi:SpoIIE family protein phosphatase [Streptomyces sp. NPDC007251]|uniref:SpoIIE family protein phosphatase n=1 Tax=Streptomyces sp. NPDC007251 TaxID=3154483 RepID=UPI0033FC470E